MLLSWTAAAASQAAGAVLFAYAIGLPAIVLIRTQVSTFQARGDTTTPMLVSLIAIACNVALKMALWRDFGAPGLALATATGVWINLCLLFALGIRRGLLRPEPGLAALVALALIAAVVAASIALLTVGPLNAWLAGRVPFEKPVLLGAVSLAAGAAYLAIVAAGLRFGGLMRLLR